MTPAKRVNLGMVTSEQARSLGLGNIICKCIANCEAELRKDLYGASPTFFLLLLFHAHHCKQRVAAQAT